MDTPAELEVHPALAAPVAPPADRLLTAIREDLLDVLKAPSFGIAELRRISHEAECAVALLLSRAGINVDSGVRGLYGPGRAANPGLDDEDDEDADDATTPMPAPVTETYGAAVLRELIAALPGLRAPAPDPVCDDADLRQERFRAIIDAMEIVRKAKDNDTAIAVLEDCARGTLELSDAARMLTDAIAAMPKLPTRVQEGA